MDLAILPAGDDDIVLGHVAHDEVALFGDLAFMAQQQPGLGEDLLHLQMVELLVGHHAQRDLVGIAHDKIVERCAVAQGKGGFLEHVGVLSHEILLLALRYTH